MVSWKGKTKAGIIDDTTLVSNGLDIYPTILRMAGLPVPLSLHGVDLSPNTLQDPGEDNPVSRDYVVSEIEQKIYKGHTRGTFTGRMVVTDSFKYILFDKGVNREQLFDISYDPGELNPVTDYPDYLHDLTSCREILKEWVTTTEDDFNVDDIVSQFKSDALIDALLINNVPVTGFKPNTFFYALEFDSTDSVVLGAVPVNSGAEITITQASDIRGDSAARTANILVVSEDGSNSNTYNVQINVTKTGSVSSSGANYKVSVFPNPATHTLNVDIDGEAINKVMIYDLMGQLLYNEVGITNHAQINIDHLSYGTYLLEAENDVETIRVKFIKTN